MLKRQYCMLALVVVLCVAAGAANALPTYRGYTGLMLIPSADALCKGNFDAGVFFEDVGSGTVNDYNFNYGVADGLELGINRYRQSNEYTAGTWVNGKYRFLDETESRPAVAGGIIDLTNDNETTVYIVASKSLTTPIEAWEGEILNPRIHVGFGGGYLNSLFAGVSAYLGDRVDLMFEWDSAQTQVGANFRITPGLTVHAGFFNIFRSGTLGAGVSFGRYY